MTRQERAAWLFSAPVLAIIALVFILPTALAMALSITDYSIYALADLTNLRFVGLGNFIDLFSTPLFWRASRQEAYPAGGAYFNRLPLRLNDKLGYDFGLAVYTTASSK